MPALVINGKEHQVKDGRRLVLAIQDAGINIGHLCGGLAKCTTCRIVFNEGEPALYTPAEHERLEAEGLLGEARLACQVRCMRDLDVEVLMTMETEGWDSSGPTPGENIEPDPDECLFIDQIT